MAALYLVGGPAPQWPLITPVAVPVLMAGYVLCLYRPGTRELVGGAAGMAAWAVILILSVAPWPAVAGRMRQNAGKKEERARAQALWEQQDKERRRMEGLAKLKDMAADAPIPSWYELLDPQNGVRAEALEALRHVERRQSDIEEMLGYGITASMALLPELDLKATPQLCEAAKTYLRKNAKDSRRRPQNEPVPFELTSYEKASLEGIRWVALHGCDCTAEIEVLQDSARTQLDSADRKTFLGVLDEIKHQARTKPQP